MAAIFALENLFAAVKPRIEGSFTVGGRVLVSVVWGRTRPPSSLDVGTIGRVVFVPGALNGDVGEIGGAKQWRQPARALRNLSHKFHVYIYGRSLVEKSDDRAHDHAAFRVLHEVIRQIVAYSTDVSTVGSPVTLASPQLLKPLSVGNLGREYLLPGTIDQPILDMIDDDPDAVNVAPAVADITDTLGDRSEQSET